MTNTELKKRIEEKLGLRIEYSQQCETLAEAIYEATGERLGITTLKRLFGFVGEKVVPRASTMDIIARYVGYPSYRLLAKDMGTDTDISAFTPVDSIEAAALATGTQLQITYDPNRLIVMTYIGSNNFIINESQGSKLMKGDVVTITQMCRGFELLATAVVRDGVALGPYHAAKEGGLTSIEVIV